MRIRPPGGHGQSGLVGRALAEDGGQGEHLGVEDLLRVLKLNIKFSDISFFSNPRCFPGGVAWRECD